MYPKKLSKKYELVSAKKILLTKNRNSHAFLMENHKELRSLKCQYLQF